jgi:ABC-type cobalt transport system substrate-binding protein
MSIKQKPLDKQFRAYVFAKAYIAALSYTNGNHANATEEAKDAVINITAQINSWDAETPWEPPAARLTAPDGPVTPIPITNTIPKPNLGVG